MLGTRSKGHCDVSHPHHETFMRHSDLQAPRIQRPVGQPRSAVCLYQWAGPGHWLWGPHSFQNPHLQLARGSRGGGPRPLGSHWGL